MQATDVRTVFQENGIVKLGANKYNLGTKAFHKSPTTVTEIQKYVQFLNTYSPEDMNLSIIVSEWTATIPRYAQWDPNIVIVTVYSPVGPKLLPWGV